MKWCERRDKRASLLSDKAACILGFSALKQFFHVLPLLLVFLFICLSYPVHLLPLRGEALAAPRPFPSQFLSLFLFPLIFFSSLNNLLQQGRVEVRLF